MKYYLVIKYDEDGNYNRKYVMKSKLNVEPGENEKVHEIQQQEYMAMKYIYTKSGKIGR